MKPETISVAVVMVAVGSALLAGCGGVYDDAMSASSVEADGIGDVAAFRSPESRTIAQFGTRSLTLLTYPAGKEECQNGWERIPHFALVGTPSVRGFGPVWVWEDQRLLVSSASDAWWVLADLGGNRGVSLLVAYDNYGAEGPIELHVYQEPQENNGRMKWWFFVWIPFELSHDGFVLRPAVGPDAIRIEIETLRGGRLVNVGEIRSDPAADAIRLYMRNGGSGAE
jgi:hypothetical protein